MEIRDFDALERAINSSILHLESLAVSDPKNDKLYLRFIEKFLSRDLQQAKELFINGNSKRAKLVIANLGRIGIPLNDQIGVADDYPELHRLLDIVEIECSNITRRLIDEDL